MEEVGSTDSYALSLALSREGLVCGPSSGFNLQGLYQFIEKRKAAGTLSSLADPDSGDITCVFLCCDLPYQYINEYFAALAPTNFHPITNHQNLTHVDRHRYDESWKLPAPTALHAFFDLASGSPLPATSIIDLRHPTDFACWHLPAAVNAPQAAIDRNTPSPFADAKVLAALWRELEAFFGAEGGSAALREKRVLLVCYDGDAARVATSVLRARGVRAESVRGGVGAVREWWGREVVQREEMVQAAACFERNEQVEVVQAAAAAAAAPVRVLGTA
ncbi:hypothetical protein SLS55_009742 [Diplodia seriata]|uniref:Rhodanese domain-containing protein n=1 Tax=Diplodia seriata TaxID=420778 RepID=A0ABR3C0W1_9PEZI